ncbi:MAG: RNAse [Ignavibacteria bacterium]|nr:RNAse [Ignavibacteria bacterium]
MFRYLYNIILRRKYFNKLRFLARSHTYNVKWLGILPENKKSDIEKTFNLKIKNLGYYEQAFTHRSYLQISTFSKSKSNERMEFLGDAILGFIVGEFLFTSYSDSFEGDLTKMRSWLVNKNSLALCARKLGLSQFILLSHSAERSLRTGSDSMLADCLEAVIAAIYLDGGFSIVKQFILEKLLPIIMNDIEMEDSNYKSILLESLQAKCKKAPSYVIIEEKGPDHDKEFIIGVYLDRVLMGQGTGKSKKQAEQLAAQNALENGINIIETEEDVENYEISEIDSNENEMNDGSD